MSPTISSLRSSARLFCILFGLSLFALTPTSFAQQALSPDPSATEQEYLDRVEIVSPAETPVDKRLFGVIPNYRAAQTLSGYIPLTTTEKFRIARSDSFDWPNYILLAGFALESQIVSSGFRSNGGYTGFAESYGRSVVDQIVGSYLTEAILPSLLHEDPRFFRIGKGTFWHRVSYAASRVVVTRTDSGATKLNITELAGNAGFVALSSVYYPNSRTPAEGATRYGMQLGNDVISNLMTEFWPDIKHRLHSRRWLLIAVK